MTDPSWNANDYLFEFPDIPRYEGELVKMPIHHRVEKVRKFLVEEILGEAERALHAHAELSAMLLLLAAVDYLTGFYKGKQSTKWDYVEFMRRYFPGKYHPYLEAIYDQLRSGLMHNLVAANPWRPQDTTFLIHPSSAQHLETNAEGKLVISVGHFRVDTCRAWRMHAHDIIMKGAENPELVTNFIRRFNKLDGIGAFMERVPD